MIKKIFTYLFILIYFCSSFTELAYAVSSNNDLNSYADDLRYIYDEENLKEIFLEQLSLLDMNIDSLGFTETEEEYIKKMQSEPFYYVHENYSNISIIEGKNYSIESLIISQINRVLNTEIQVVQAEDLGAESIEDVAEIVYSNANFFSSVYTSELEPSVTREYIQSDFYNNKEFYVVSTNMDYLNNFDSYTVGSSILDKIAISSDIDDMSYFMGNKDYDTLIYTPLKAKEKLLDREIDYYVCDINSLQFITEKSNLVYKKLDYDLMDLNSNMFAFFTNYNNKTLFSIIDKIISKLDKSVIRDYNYAYRSYLLSKVLVSSLTDEEIELINSIDKLNVAVIDLKSITEIKDDKLYGYTADVLELISKMLNIDFNYVDITGETYVDVIKNDRINVLPYVMYTQSEEIRKSFMEINIETGVTDNYINRKFEILKHNETEDITQLSKLKYVDVGTLRDLEIYANEFFKNTIGSINQELQLYDSMDDLAEALQDGSIKYALATPGASSYYEREFSSKQRIQLAYDVSTNISEKNFEWVMLISKGDDTKKLINLFNKSIQAINLHELSSNWFNYSMNYENYQNLKKTNEYTTFAIIVAGIAGLIAIVILVRRSVASTKKMREISTKDTLTGLTNKETMFSDMQVNKTDFYAILINIINFKKINEIYGLIIADEILAYVGEKLKDIEGITRYETKAYRLEKDEFLLVIFDDEDFNEIAYLNYLNEKLKDTVFINNLSFNLNFSISAISSSYVNNDFRQALIYINNMLIKNKSRPDLDYVIFDDKENKEILEYIDIEKSLYNVTERNILPYFQPFIDTRTGDVKGCEVLARLYLNGNICQPYKFIPIAEKNGLLDDIDRLLFRRTLTIREQLLREGIIDDEFYFSLNISAQFLKELSIEYLDKIMVEFNIKDFSFLQMEVLEEKLSDEEAQKIFEIVTSKNIKSAIDDFSTGYSSLLRLMKHFKFKVLKIDKSLLPVNFTDKDKSVYKAIVDVVKKLDLSIVSEGVETREHAEFLRTLDIDVFQGYFFSRPVPLEEFKQYIVVSNRKS
ncbi:MAG: EAL domain-containing protein [Lachnospirales bacterium]